MAHSPFFLDLGAACDELARASLARGNLTASRVPGFIVSIAESFASEFFPEDDAPPEPEPAPDVTEFRRAFHALQDLIETRGNVEGRFSHHEAELLLSIARQRAEAATAEA
jgi:hypothetical protein